MNFWELFTPKKKVIIEKEEKMIKSWWFIICERGARGLTL